MKIRVLIADDQSMVRAGFRMLLSGEQDIEVVAEARDGLEAVAQAARLDPTVILMDWSARPPTRLGIVQSMGRPGSALDNAVIESWHSTLEFELRAVEHFSTRAAARARVSTWIEDYNTRRRHSALGMMTPVRYEQALQE
jgi:transposase InsO family protein